MITKLKKTKLIANLEIIGCILPSIIAIIYVYKFGVNVAYWDEWDFVPFIDKFYSGTLSIGSLFAQHNEHRIFFPKVAMLIVSHFSKYNNVAQMFFSQGLLILCTLIVFLVFHRQFKINHRLYWFIPAPFLIFNLRQYENLLWGFQSVFLFVTSFTLLCLYFLYILCEETRIIKSQVLIFFLAIVSATITTFSAAMGPLIWIAGLLQIFISPIVAKLKKIYMILWALVGLFEWKIYFLNYHKPVHAPSMFEAIYHPFSLFKYLCAGIGSSLFGQIQTAIVTGFIILSFLIVLVTLLYKEGRVTENRFWLSSLAFLLITVVLMAIGRLGYGVESAMVSRYTSFSLLIILCTYFLFLDFALNFKIKVLVTILFSMFGGFLILSIPISYMQGVSTGEEIKVSRERAAFILQTFETQPDKMLKQLYPWAEVVRQRAPILKKMKYNVFADDSNFPSISGLSQLSTPTQSSIDYINQTQIKNPAIPLVIDAKDDYILVSGWAVDSVDKDVAGGVIVEIDGKQYPGFYGIERNDVAAYYKNEKYKFSGYERAIPISEIGNGHHILTIKIISNDKKSYYDSARNVLLNIKK